LQLWNDGYAIDAAVAKGHRLILSPCSYLYVDHGNYKGQPGADWCRGEGVPLQRVYSFDPAPFKSAVGIEAALWTEYVHSDAAADDRLWPRLAAVAELAWSPAGQRGYAGFVQRMGALRPQLDALGIHYHAEPDLDWA
ncbi:family 20 glycosylhydrolase, partial [Lysobacter sp. 2RAB21]